MDASLLEQTHQTQELSSISLQDVLPYQMRQISKKSNTFVRTCKVTGCKNSVNSRGLCCSCTSLLKRRLETGEINKDQYNSLLDPKRQGRQRSAQFDEWMKKTLEHNNK